MGSSYFKQLSDTLFDGESKAGDVKLMPGTWGDASEINEKVAKELLDSMNRTGITKNGALNIGG